MDSKSLYAKCPKYFTLLPVPCFSCVFQFKLSDTFYITGCGNVEQSLIAVSVLPCFFCWMQNHALEHSYSQWMAQRKLKHVRGEAGQGHKTSYEPSSCCSYLAWRFSLKCTCSSTLFSFSFFFISHVDLSWFSAALFLPSQRLNSSKAFKTLL